MTVVETVLVFVGIPLAATALMALATLGPGAARAPRYRPGGSWDHPPVWYLPHPDRDEPAADGPGRLALQGSVAVAEPVRATGGASGEW